jgi:prepilin-type N-terminal cleavage/methylation domain-containing protein
MRLKIIRQPRGFTLIEVAVATTLAAMVMGGATALLVGLLRTNDVVHERLEQIAVRSRLASLFRADVAGAKFCTILDEKRPESGILLRTVDEHKVRYIAGEHDVQRIAETGDKVSAREIFHLGEQQRATLTSTTDSLRMVRCTIEQSAPLPETQQRLAGMKPHAALTIAAVLGRSGRLMTTLQKAVARPKAVPQPAPDAEPEPDADADSSTEPKSK